MKPERSGSISQKVIAVLCFSKARVEKMYTVYMVSRQVTVVSLQYQLTFKFSVGATYESPLCTAHTAIQLSFVVS